MKIPYILKINCTTFIYPHFDSPLFYFGKSINVIHDLGILNHKESSRYYGYFRKIFKLFIYKLKLISTCKIVAISNFTKKDLIQTFKLIKKN